MQFSVLKSRTQQNVEDVSNDIYPSAEVSDAVNNAKDEVLSLVRIFTDEFPSTSTSITFAVGDSEKALPSDFLEIMRAESIPGTNLAAQGAQLIDFRNQDHTRAYFECQGLWVRRDASGTYYLGRRYTDSAQTFTVYYRPDVSDLSSSSSSFTFGPPPCDNLIICKATIQLLAARKRNTTYWQQKEQKLEQQLSDNLKNTNDASPRYVNYTEDTYGCY